MLDGEPWVVVRSLGPSPNDVVLEGASLDDANASSSPTGMAKLIDTLGERFITPEVSKLFAASPRKAWLLALAWLSRDQECHFSKATDWRSTGGKSISESTHIIRALTGAITPREHELQGQYDKLREELDGELQDLQRRRWLAENSQKQLVKALQIEGPSVPQGDLVIPFLRETTRKRLAKVAVVDTRGEVVSPTDLDTLATALQSEVDRLGEELKQQEMREKVAAAEIKMIESERAGLAMSLEDAQTPACPICEVPIDRALAQGCRLSHKLPDLEALQARRAKDAQDLQNKRLEEQDAKQAAAQLRLELTAAREELAKVRRDLSKAQSLRDERAEAWGAARRLNEDVDHLDDVLAHIRKSERKIEQVKADIEALREEVENERQQHAAVFTNLGAHFDPLVRRLLGRVSDARGRVHLDGKGLHLTVDFGGERVTPAIDLVKVLAFDLATLCRSIEGATRLPAFLIHDSPRSSDLGLSLFHELFRVMHELESVGEAPLFQYILTTTSRPPDELVDDPRIRLKLCGAPADARLLKRDL